MQYIKSKRFVFKNTNQKILHWFLFGQKYSPSKNIKFINIHYSSYKFLRESFKITLNNATFTVMASLEAQMVKASAYKVRHRGSIPGSGRSLEKGMATHSTILVWEIPWTEEPGVLIVHGVEKSHEGLSDFTSLFLGPP